MSVSLPVMIFNKSTLLQAYSKNMGFFPIFGEMAAKETDPIKRMKIVVLNCIVINHFAIMLKPFNPIIGETY